MRRDSGGDAEGDAVLQIKQIGEFTIEAVRPNDVAGLRRAQLDRSPKRLSRAAHAAMQHIAYVKLVADASKIERCACITKRGAARDDQQVLKAAKQADDVVHHALGEIGVR